MHAKEFGRYISLIEPCFYHNLDPHYVVLETTLRGSTARRSGHPIVKSMAQGAYYYGENQWMKEFAA